MAVSTLVPAAPACIHGMAAGFRAQDRRTANSAEASPGRDSSTLPDTSRPAPGLPTGLRRSSLPASQPGRASLLA
ncbi:hypothetical protein [Actinoplanes sp. NPDC020271]|uniref:hypothetical protein n=1 Tax=Actinoplanes sp. NPDC020271 TaxID=3363896 RepID=UPI0037B27349